MRIETFSTRPSLLDIGFVLNLRDSSFEMVSNFDMEAPRCKQLGIFDPKGGKSIRNLASNPRPKGRGMRRAVRVQISDYISFEYWSSGFIWDLKIFLRFRWNPSNTYILETHFAHS